MWLGHHFQGQKVNGQLAGAVAHCGGLPHKLLCPASNRQGALSDDAVWRLSVCLAVWRLSVAYIGPKSKATSVPILVFLGLFVLDLGPMYATDRRQTDVRQHYRLMPRLLWAGHNKCRCAVGLSIMSGSALCNRLPCIAVLYYNQKQVFRSLFFQLSTDLAEIWQGSVVGRSAPESSIWPGSVHGRLQAKR